MGEGKQPIPLFRDKHQPPAIFEYFVDCLWFETSGIHNAKVNAPLKGKQKADIVIAGGGFAGLASAFHLVNRFPKKRIVLLEGACCGYGASGRNGGIISSALHGLGKMVEKEGPEKARRLYDSTELGRDQIVKLVEEHGIDCDLEMNGWILLAAEEKHIGTLHAYKALFDLLKLQTKIIEKDDLRKSIKSDRYFGGWFNPDAGHCDPAKLARGMKELIEDMGVEVFERSRILRIRPGKRIVVETEFGEIEAPDVVVTLNGYAPKIGLFKGRVVPLTNNMIATEPLSSDQLDSIGWKGREALSDTRPLFDYFRLTADNRIAFGGEEMLYFYENAPSYGNHKPVINNLMHSLYTSFPQLEGVRITHEWAGTLGYTRDFFPSIGVMGEHKNLYYATGFSGGGLVLTQLSGMIISALMAGDQNDLIHLPFVNHKMPWMGFEPFRYPISRLALKLMEYDISLFSER
jgi:glycine/D-amino acid oxidase-like deaminating enzyme